MRVEGLIALVCLALITAASPAQDAETRRIDTHPRIELRPPSDHPDTHLPRASASPGLAPTTRSDRDRRLDLELDLEERRRTRADGDGSGGSHYVAAVACVVGSGLVLVSFLSWASKRRAG
jgi:hypothetical protein